MTTPQKVAFITGANRGIGLETARALGKAGIAVVLGVRDLQKGEGAAEELRAEGSVAEVIRFDANDPTTFDDAYTFFDSKYGRLDILVNNAGISPEKSLKGLNTSSSVPPAMLRETFETNVFSVVELTQKLLPLIKKAPAGRIVNLSSVLGSNTLHSDSSSHIYGLKRFAYNSSKAALNSFTIHLAHELRDTKIKVNSAHPGWVRTELGGAEAPLDIPDGAKTSFELATIGEDGPNGGYFHMGKTIPW